MGDKGTSMDYSQWLINHTDNNGKCTNCGGDPKTCGCYEEAEQRNASY